MNAEEFFHENFRNMVSEVAHDITIAMTPPEGYAVTGVFGVPEGLVLRPGDGTVSVTIGSAFLSNNNGGIYASIGPGKSSKSLTLTPLDGDAALLDVQLSYVDAITGTTGEDSLAIAQPGRRPPERLSAAMLLVDEFLTLDRALDTYHSGGEPEETFALLDGLADRLGDGRHAGFDSEEELVGGLRDRMAFAAGYLDDIPASMRPMAILGEWKVTYHKGVADIARGDRLELTDDGEIITYRDEAENVYEHFNANERMVSVIGEDDDEPTRFSYRLNGDRLHMRTRDGLAMISLQRD